MIPMRILYISTEAVGAPHGGGVHTWEAARHLARLGHAVTVACPSGDGLPSEEMREKVRILRRRMRLGGRSFPLLLGAAAPSLWDDRFDAVLSRASALGGADVVLSRWLGAPLVLEVNNPHLEEILLRGRVPGFLAPLLRLWTSWLADRADGAVTPCARIAPPGAAVLEIPWGVDPERFVPAARLPGVRERVRAELGLGGGPVAVFTGTFRRWHGVLAIPRIARAVLSRLPGAVFLLVGDGDERAATEAACEGLPRGALRFLGSQPYARMPGILAACDVGIAPFAPEENPLFARFGFYYSPLKILEYMAAGLPVVTYAVPELAAIVEDGRAGRTPAPGDDGAFAAAVADLLADPVARARMGAAARARAESRYGWDAHARKLSDFLEGIIGAPSAGAHRPEC